VQHLGCLPPALDWQAIRHGFEVEGVASEWLGKRHGCSRVTIQLRAKAEGWRRPDGHRPRPVKPDPDWTAVRAGYEAGVPVAELARQHAAPANSIRHRAARDGWCRTAQAGTRTTAPDPRRAAFTARWPAARGEFPTGVRTLTAAQWEPN